MHNELVSCVSWMSPDDVVSIANDQKILKWNLVTAETYQLGELPPPEGASHPTDMHWFPRGQSGRGGGGGGGGNGGQARRGEEEQRPEEGQSCTSSPRQRGGCY